MDESRLALLRENCTRLGVTGVDITQVSTLAPLDSTAPSPAPFDRIIVDAPCSNTGVLRRRVDLRWRLRLAEIERLQNWIPIAIYRDYQNLLCFRLIDVYRKLGLEKHLKLNIELPLSMVLESYSNRFSYETNSMENGMDISIYPIPQVSLIYFY